ncbi:hypothetical protein ACX27O_09665 [Micromonospora sp. SD19]
MIVTALFDLLARAVPDCIGLSGTTEKRGGAHRKLKQMLPLGLSR